MAVTPVLMERATTVAPDASAVELTIYTSTLREFAFEFQIDGEERYLITMPAGHDVIRFNASPTVNLVSEASFWIDGVEIYTVPAVADVPIVVSIAVSPEIPGEDGALIETLIVSACEYPAL